MGKAPFLNFSLIRSAFKEKETSLAAAVGNNFYLASPHTSTDIAVSDRMVAMVNEMLQNEEVVGLIVERCKSSLLQGQRNKAVVDRTTLSEEKRFSFPYHAVEEFIFLLYSIALHTNNFTPFNALVKQLGPQIMDHRYMRTKYVVRVLGYSSAVDPGIHWAEAGERGRDELTPFGRQVWYLTHQPGVKPPFRSQT